MICPYSFINVEQVNQNRYEYDIDGHTTFHEHKMIETRKFAECVQELCGAWHDGKCVFKGDVT